MSRFRKEYRELSPAEKASVAVIKEYAEAMEEEFEYYVTDPRMKALALTKLEEAVMWAVKGITG